STLYCGYLFGGGVWWRIQFVGHHRIGIQYFASAIHHGILYEWVYVQSINAVVCGGDFNAAPTGFVHTQSASLTGADHYVAFTIESSYVVVPAQKRPARICGAGTYPGRSLATVTGYFSPQPG